MVKIIRKMTGRDYKAFCQVANAAFEGLNADQWLEDHIKKSATEDLYGMFLNEKLVAGMRVFDFEMNYASTLIKAAGVGMVAVDLLHKKEKNAYQLMQNFISLSKEVNNNIVMLYPFKVDFYKKMGFGMGTRTYQFYIPPSEFIDFEKKEHLKELSMEDRENILHCYNRIYAKTHGMTKREPIEYELNRPFLFGRVIGYKEEDQVMGYMVISHKGKTLFIHEWFFETPKVMKEFSTFLHSQCDQFDRIVIHSNLDDLNYFVHSPESGEAVMVDLPSSVDHHHMANLGIGVMYRIINCLGFFKGLLDKQHQFQLVSLSIKLTIADEFYPENQTPFILEVNDGQITNIRTEGAYDVQLAMGISEFSSLVMGVDSLRTFNKWGLATLSEEQYLNDVDRLFSTPIQPVMTKAF